MIALSVELPQTGPEIAAHLLGGRPYLWTTHPLSSGLPLFLIPELRAVSGNLRQPQATRGQVLRV